MTEDRQTSRRRQHVPDLLVEQLLLGELPPERALRIRAELESQPGGAERLNQLRRSNDELLLTYPPRSVVPFIEKRAGVRQRRSPLLVLLPVFVGATAALLLVVRSNGPTTVNPLEEPEHTKDKGAGIARVSVYTEGSVRTAPLASGSLVHAHQLLQLEYARKNATYGVIFSIDGAGGVTLHYPETPAQPQTLQAGPTPISHSVELDDAPGFERFFLVSGTAPIDIEAVLREARALAARPGEAATGSLLLPPGLDQDSVLLRKGSK